MSKEARRKALKALIRKPDKRYNPQHTLAALAESHPGPTRAVLEMLDMMLDERPEAGALELTAMLALSEINLLRGLILEKIAAGGILDADGNESPLLKTFRSLDSSLCQWVRILGTEKPNLKPEAIDIKTLWAETGDDTSAQRNKAPDADSKAVSGAGRGKDTPEEENAFEGAVQASEALPEPSRPDDTETLKDRDTGHPGDSDGMPEVKDSGQW